MTHPTPPSMAPAARVEQIGFELRRLTAEIDRHERKIKALQLEMQALVAQVQGYVR